MKKTVRAIFTPEEVAQLMANQALRARGVKYSGPAKLEIITFYKNVCTKQKPEQYRIEVEFEEK